MRIGHHWYCRYWIASEMMIRVPVIQFRPSPWRNTRGEYGYAKRKAELY